MRVIGKNRRGSKFSGRRWRSFCEALESRQLLTGDPVIVLTEAISLQALPTIINSTTVPPWLWNNPGEFAYNLDTGNWNNTDGDSNGYADDVYGWNFSGGGSPNIVNNVTGGHGANVLSYAIGALVDADDSADRVRIMIVNGTGDQITDYVIAQKDSGVNIVAVSTSTASGGQFSRSNAEDFRDEDILLFVGASNSNTNLDSATGSTLSFYNATPRRGTNAPAVKTIIPVTTDSLHANTAYGINSFYFAAPYGSQQSYSIPTAAVFAAAAVQEYQDAHSGATPTAPASRGGTH